MHTAAMKGAAMEGPHLRAPGSMRMYKRTHRGCGTWMAYVYDSTAASWACCNRSNVLADIRHVVPMLHSGRGAPANSSAK
jgi:hypothetical protein